MKNTILFIKATSEQWDESEHPRSSDGTFKQAVITEALVADAAPWRHLDLTHENWLAEFPFNEVETPMGALRLGENQFNKLIGRDRTAYFGLIKPTLQNPSFIVDDPETPERLAERRASGEVIERDSVIKFFRAFVKDGKLRAFCCVSISQDGFEIVISASERKVKQAASVISRCAILGVSAVAKEIGNFGSEDGAGEPILKAIMNKMSGRVKVFINSAITLVFPNGNHHTVAQGDYSFNIDDLIKSLEVGNDYPERRGMPANFGDRQGAVHGESRSNEVNRLHGVAGGQGLDWLRENLRSTDHPVYEDASHGMGAAQRSDPIGYAGSPAHLRQPGMCKSGAPDFGDSDGQLRGQSETRQDKGRSLGETAESQAEQDSGGIHPQAQGSGGELREYGEGVWGRAGSDFEDLHGESLAGALHKALAPGQRFITVHPNGPGTKGQAVLVQEAQHGSGVYHVIGGAGGKLNYLKLSGIKPESSYKQEASERAKAKTEVKKVQRERDKELGLDKGKGAAREAVQHQKHQGQKAFIAKVAEKMGWSEDDLKPKIPENTTLLATKKLEQKHHSALLEKANKAVDLQVQHLMADTVAREEAGIVPIANEHTPDDQLTTADLEDARPQEKASLGFAAHYAERAEEKGSPEVSIKAEADDKKKARQALMTDNQRSAIKVRGTIAKQVQAEIANIREPITADIKAVLASAHDAVELIKARKAMQSLNKAAQAANKDIDESKEVKAYNLEVSEASDDQIASDIENDLRTARTTAFLSTIKKEVSDPEKQLRQHIGAGAFNSINGLAVAGTGAALVDRSVVDVLGIAGAAQVLARRLHADLPAAEVEKLTAGMEDYHLHHYMETSKTAMQEAQDLHDTAKEIGLGEASHGADFEAARELNSKRKDCIEEAHKILGTALGEMEANAALITALKSGRNEKPFECPMGKISDEDAIRQVRAIGLNRGDYSIDKVAGNQVLTITPQGMDKLSTPVDKADMERTRNTLSILNGEQDEDNWLPQGFAKRPDLCMNLKPGVAATLAKPFTPSADLGQSLKDYIGGRTADGDSPADIMADIQSSDFFDKAGNNDGYREALDSVAPLKGQDGKQSRAETLSDTFNEYADNYVQNAYGGKISTLQRQQFEPDHVAQEALHRALADEPSGIAAYKPIGELSNDDQRTLRDYFYTHVAHESPDAANLRTRLESMGAHEPEKESTDMFGDTATNPEWTDWKAQRDTLAEEVGSASLDWQKYAGAMHGHENAYAAVQDLIKSKVATSFHETYNKLNPSAPLKLGRQVIRNNLNHLDAVDPQARVQREAEERQLIDGLRERVQGKYASGSVMDKLDATRESKEAFEQAQMGFFSAEQDGDMFGGDETSKPGKPLAADQRQTLGHAAERTIAGMVPLIGKNFKPGQPVKLFNPTMSGEGIMRQRSIKFIAANKRVSLAAGVGSGKSAMMLGAFSHLQSQGKVKKGVIVCPSAVVGEMGAEASRFLEPGKFKWHCEPGASFESRLAGYKDPDTHFSVVTHQSFRDDLLKMAGMKTGEAPSAVADRMDGMSRKERSTFTKEVLAHHGINFDFSAVDEGHNLLDRQGKENSRMSNAIGGVTDNTPYTVSSTADVVKNDISEAGSALEKLEPEKHGDRAAFMRRYGVDTQGAKDALKREMLNSVISYRLEPKGVTANKQEISVKPSEAQSKALADLDKNIGAVRMARMEGKTNVEAMKAISPGQFKDVPEDQHEALAKELASSLGIIKGSAVRNILDSHPESAKIDALAKLATERKGKPGVVFAHSLEAVANIKKRLEADGHRVMTLTGGDSSEDKAAKIRGFNPGKGDRTHDIMVASDAGSTGINLQNSSWLTQFDSPMTAMGHAQRNGRIHRTGQKNPNIELMDLVSDHPSERAARERLKTKYALRELMSSPYEAADDTGLAHFLHQRKVEQQNALI